MRHIVTKRFWCFTTLYNLFQIELKSFADGWQRNPDGQGSNLINLVLSYCNDENSHIVWRVSLQFVSEIFMNFPRSYLQYVVCQFGFYLSWKSEKYLIFESTFFKCDFWYYILWNCYVIMFNRLKSSQEISVLHDESWKHHCAYQ